MTSAGGRQYTGKRIRPAIIQSRAVVFVCGLRSGSCLSSPVLRHSPGAISNNRLSAVNRPCGQSVSGPVSSRWRPPTAKPIPRYPCRDLLWMTYLTDIWHDVPSCSWRQLTPDPVSGDSRMTTSYWRTVLLVTFDTYELLPRGWSTWVGGISEFRLLNGMNL